MGFWMSSFAVQTEAWTPLNAHKVLHRLWSSLDLIFHLSRNRVAPQMCLRAPSSFPCLNHAHGWGSSFSSSQTLLHCHLLQEDLSVFSSLPVAEWSGKSFLSYSTMPPPHPSNLLRAGRQGKTLFPPDAWGSSSLLPQPLCLSLLLSVFLILPCQCNSTNS